MRPHKDQFTVNVTLLATETDIVHNQWEHKNLSYHGRAQHMDKFTKQMLSMEWYIIKPTENYDQLNIHWQQGNNSEQSPLGTWWCYIGNKVWIKETREHIWFGTSTFLRSAHAWNATWYTVNSLNMKPPRLWMYSAVGVLYNSSSVIPIITFSALSLVDSTDDHPLDCSTSSIIYSTERKIS